MASQVYNIAKGRLGQGLLDLDDDVIKCLLVMAGTAAGGAGAKEHDSLGAFTTLDELDTITGYTAGGEVITGTGVTESASIDKSSWDATDITWTSVVAGKRIVGAVVYEDVGSLLIAYLEFANSFTTGGGDVVVTWNASGLMLIA